MEFEKSSVRNPTGRDAEERFRLLVESVKDYAIFMLDANGQVVTWNAGAQRIKGYSAGEIIGKHFSVFYPIEDVIAGKCERELEIAAREGRFEDEGWRVRKDGTLMWANVVITALRSPDDGTLFGFAKVTRDLSERRKAEAAQRQLAAQQAALAEKTRIQEFLERFIAILGHDLRNPLSAIDMNLTRLREKVADPALARMLDRMASSSTRMSRMIGQILDLTRSRLAGRLELQRAPMDLRDALTRIVEELRAAQPDRTIDLRSPSLPGTWDRDRLEQVFSNLVGNALLYGDRDRPITVEAGDGAMIYVDVHNHGAPIPNEVQADLFNPFRRATVTEETRKGGEGLGLGLYISRELVAAHGGTIDVRSAPGHGTTFRVALPRG